MRAEAAGFRPSSHALQALGDQLTPRCLARRALAQLSCNRKQTRSALLTLYTVATKASATTRPPRSGARRAQGARSRASGRARLEQSPWSRAYPGVDSGTRDRSFPYASRDALSSGEQFVQHRRPGGFLFNHEGETVAQEVAPSMTLRHRPLARAALCGGHVDLPSVTHLCRETIERRQLFVEEGLGPLERTRARRTRRGRS